MVSAYAIIKYKLIRICHTVLLMDDSEVKMKPFNLFNYMDYVYTVYQERSFTRAAEKLYITQPALSLCIKKVETEFGYPIFERSGKDVTPTPIGEKYIKAIEDVMKIQNRLYTEMDDILHLKNGKIRIGSTAFVTSYILPDILKSFKDKFPDIQISMVVMESGELENCLEENDVDIVIDNATVFLDGCKYTPLLNERILLGVPKNLSINESIAEYKISKTAIKAGEVDYSKAPKLGVAELRSEEFILLEKGSKMRQVATRIFDESKMIPKVSIEFDRLNIAVSYAQAGFGICFITDTTLKYGDIYDNLNVYIPDTEFSYLTLYVIHKKNKHLSSTMREFINHLKA